MANLEIRGLIAPNFQLIIDDLQQQINQLRIDLTALELRVTQNEIDILDLQTRVTLLETQVAQLIIDVNQAQLDIIDLQNRVTQLEIDVAQLQVDLTALEDRVDILEEYFDTKQSGTTVVDVTKAINFTGSVTVTQDGINPNQANIAINDQAIDVYRNGVLFQADVLEIDFADELSLTNATPDRVEVSYTRPLIVSKDSGSQVVADTLSIDVTGDLTATGNMNEVTIDYVRPLIESLDHGTPIVADTLNIDIQGELVATPSTNQLNISYTRPKLITKLANSNIVTDTLSNNFTSTVNGDIGVTLSASTQANINIANQRHTVQNNSSNVVTGTTIVNYSSDFTVTNPSGTTALVVPRARSVANTTRTLNNNFIVSATRDAICTYTFSFTNSTSLVGGTSGSVAAQTSPDAITFTTQASAGNGMGGGLILGIAVTATNIIPVTIYVPAGFTVRLQTTGTGVTYLSSMEVLL